MCCLKYEHPLYQEFKADAPRIGARVAAPQGEGRVVGYNVPSETVVVRLSENGRRCACTKADVCGSRQAYDSARGSGTMRTTPDVQPNRGDAR
jgi:cell fate regulator YaaT (PSP1 superfamily)